MPNFRSVPNYPWNPRFPYHFPASLLDPPNLHGRFRLVVLGKGSSTPDARIWILVAEDYARITNMTRKDLPPSDERYAGCGS